MSDAIYIRCKGNGFLVSNAEKRQYFPREALISVDDIAGVPENESDFIFANAWRLSLIFGDDGRTAVKIWKNPDGFLCSKFIHLERAAANA